MRRITFIAAACAAIDYHVYTQPPFEDRDFVAPLNNGGQVPQISHWFVSGEKNGTESPSESPSSSDDDDGGELPDTGGSPMILLTPAAGLLFAGLFALRQRFVKQ